MQKEALLKQQGRSGTKLSRPYRVAINRKPGRKISSPPVSPPKQDTHEDTFWNTPGASEPPLRFDNLLTDELAELGDVSMSFSSPITVRTAISSPAGSSRANEPSTPTPVGIPEALSGLESSPYEDKQVPDEDEDVDLDEEADKTVVLTVKPTLSIPESPPSAPPVTETKSPGTNSAPQPGTPSGPKKSRVRINSEVERIVVCECPASVINITQPSF